jgi:hypothetical protein
MLSGYGQDPDTVAFSLSHADARSGPNTYQTTTLAARYKVFDGFQFTASVPYLNIEGREEILVETVPGVFLYNEFDYSVSDLGDAIIAGWFNCTYPFLDNHGEDDPSFHLGVGVKLDTGEDDAFDPAKYAYDRSMAIPVEFSDSDGILPPRFQTGTGTTDVLFGLVYQQRFGRFEPTAGISYQLRGGENSVGYERSDRMSWSAGTLITLWQMDPSRRLYAVGGVSGITIPQDDIDHSENALVYGLQERGDVEGSRGSYYFYNLGLGVDITRNLSVSGSCTLPINDPDEETAYSFDRSFSASLQVRF